MATGKKKDYSKIIRLCTGNESGGPGDEPAPYTWGDDAGLSDGYGTIHKLFWFTHVNGRAFGTTPLNVYEGVINGIHGTYPPRSISPVEILTAKGFPVKYEELTDLNGNQDERYKQFHYLGNGTIRHDDVDSEIWIYDAEYTTRSYDRNADTPPWELPPTDISFSFPSETKPFKYAYDLEGKKFANREVSTESGMSFVRSPVNPVVNTAGTPLTAETTEYICQMSFNYALKPSSNLDISTVLNAQGSVNKRKIKLCGLNIPALRAKIVSLEPQYIDTPSDASMSVMTPYWSMHAVVQLFLNRDSAYQKLLNIGPYARHSKLAYVGLNGIIINNQYAAGALGPAEPLYWWRPFDQTNGQVNNGAIQVGNKACLLQAKKVWLGQGNNYHTKSFNYQQKFGDFVHNELEDIPLDENGMFDRESFESKQYKTREFLEFKPVDWDTHSIFSYACKGKDIQW